MDLPPEQMQLLLAAYDIVEGDLDRRILARAIIKRFDFGLSSTDWMFEAIENMADLGYLVPLSRDGEIGEQPIQLTRSGMRLAEERELPVALPSRRGSPSSSKTRYYQVPAGWPSDIPPEDSMEVDPPASERDDLAHRSDVVSARQVRIVRDLAPVARQELLKLIETIENQRLNDPDTAVAVNELRHLHSVLGDIMDDDGEPGKFEELFQKLKLHGGAFLNTFKHGVKLAVVAPALTLGISHIICRLTGVTMDTQLVGAVYAAMVGSEALRQLSGKKRAEG